MLSNSNTPNNQPLKNHVYLKDERSSEDLQVHERKWLVLHWVHESLLGSPN